VLHVEQVNRGLVTSRDPSLLQEGELQRTDEALYRPNSQALHPIGYRLKQGLQQKNPNTGLPYAITGLRRLIFEGAAARTLISDGEGRRWRYGPQTDGTWTILPDVSQRTPGLGIEAVQYGNRYVLANGVDSQHVLAPNLTRIPLGMTLVAGLKDSTGTPQPVAGVTNVDFTVALSPNPPVNVTWPNPPGYHWYWITEYDSVNAIESSYIGRYGEFSLCRAVYGSVGGRVHLITIRYGSNNYPVKVNQNATHWRIYRSPAQIQPLMTSTQDTHIYNPFPDGVRITTYDVEDADTATALIDIPIPAVPAEVTRWDYGFASAVPYPVVIISAAGIDTAIDRDPPPTWKFTTADIFEESLVTNDVTDRSIIHYSESGLIHSFPSRYTILFDTRRLDDVTLIRALGNKLVVGQKGAIWRVNFLPRSGDAEFDATRVKDLISGDHGIVGPNATAGYSLIGDIPRLAFVSRDGLYSTDGLTIDSLTTDLDWQATIRQEESSLAQTILLNIESLQALFLFYVPRTVILGGVQTVATTRLKALTFSYSAEHLKGRYLKMSGPVSLSAASADYDPVSGRLYTGGYDGQVRTEDHQELSPADIASAELISSCGVAIESRFLHLGGLDGEVVAERFWVLSGSVPIPDRQVEILGFLTRPIGGAPKSNGFQRAFEPGVMSRIEKHVTAPGIAIRVQGFAPIHFVGLEHFSRKGA